jgi:hypothetical protein
MRRGARRWSAEARVLFNPASLFRELAEDERRGVWVLVRRPLLLAFVFGCAVSLQASGRFTARLIADGAISFAFVPVFEVIALAAVYRRQPHRIGFARAVDLCFVANAPWLLWLIAFSTLRCFESPIQATAPAPVLEWIVIGSVVPTAVWSAWIDLHYFREVLPRPAGAARDLLIERAIGWSCALVYFLGYAIWPEIVGRIAA